MDLNQVFTNPSNQRYEYLLLRYDYIGRGITGEFHFLDANGQRLVKNGAAITSDWSGKESDLFNRLGQAGWRLVSHSVVDVPENKHITYHYAKFVRPL